MSETLARRLGGAAFWSYAGAITERLVRFGSFVLIAHAVTPAEFGIVTLVTLLLGFLQDFLDTGLGQALVRQDDLDDRTYDSAFWLAVAFGAAVSAATLGIGLGFADVLRPAGLGIVLQAMSPWPLLMALGSIHTAKLVRVLGFKALSIRLMLASIVSGVIGVILARLGWGVDALIARSLSYAVLHTVALWVFSGWRPRLRFHWRWLQPLARDTSRLLGSSVLGQINARAYDLAAGTFLGAAAVGAFRVAGQTVSILIDLTAGPVAGVAFSALARTREDAAASRTTFVLLARLSAILIFPAFVGLGLLGDLLMPLLFGNQWQQAVTIMPLLALLALPIHFQMMLLAALFAAGRTDRMLHWQVAQCVTTLMTVVIGMPFGLEGVAVAAVVRLYLLMPLGGVWMNRYTDIPVSLLARTIAPVLFAAAAMGVAVASVRAMLPSGLTPLAEVAILTLIGIGCMIACLPFVAPELSAKLPMLRQRLANRVAARDHA